jgi:hypothetical protein
MLGGLDVFLPYVKDYVNTFMGESITTEQWKSHLYSYYQKHGGPEKIQALDSVDWTVSNVLSPATMRIYNSLNLTIGLASWRRLETSCRDEV